MKTTLWISILVLTGCLKPSSVTCGETICPSDTICAAVTDPDQTVCATPAQLAACSALHDHARCSTDAIATGRCYSGVCLPATCGNGRIDSADPSDPSDVGEVCDDGNQVSGDGCSADCLSDETCGNGVVDSAKQEQCDDGNLVDHDGCDSTCQPETLVWQQATFIAPSNREQFAIAWDGATHQIVLFGGSDLTTSAVLRDTWIWDGRGWRQMAPDVSPIARKGAAMAYDSERRRVVLFGGVGASNVPYNDTWEWDGAQWHAVAPPVSPLPRWQFSMTYDGKRHHTVIYGGRHSFTAAPYDNADTWAWDGTAWTQIQTPHTPPPAVGSSQAVGQGRCDAAMAFDPVRGVVILVGGQSSKHVSQSSVSPVGVTDNHVWELDDTDWHEIVPAGAAQARYAAGLAWDPTAMQMLVVGGFASSSNNAIGDEWHWNGTAYTAVTPTPLPAARAYHGMATAFERGAITLFGGETATDATTWEWNGTRWTSPALAQPVLGGSSVVTPTPLATLDTLRGRVVALDPSGATFERVNAGWAKLATGGPSSTYSSALGYHPASGKTVYVSAGAPSATWTWDGVAWTDASSAALGDRCDFHMALDRNGHLVAFGGSATATATNYAETWTWDGTAWTKQTPAHSPSGRQFAGIAYDAIHGQTLLFGGDSGSAFAFGGSLGDTWSWDGTDWTQLSPATSPSPRVAAQMTYEPNRGRVILVGGVPEGVSDVWEWDGATWVQLDVPPQPAGRNGATVYPEPDGSGIDMLGGWQALGAELADVWTLRWQGPRNADTCDPANDFDGDGLAGCMDRDCWFVCTPECSPGITGGACTAPACGDGVCGPVESCRSCPADCGACTPVCGDGICDPGETCPGDC